MNIVVCVKLTPDAGDIQVRGDGSISLDKARWVIGSLDLQAVEAGLQLAEATVGKLIALSAGPAQIDNSLLKKDLLSRGPDELALVVDDALRDADTAVTAEVLVAAIRKLGPVDLILCGEGSADLYFQQVGLQVGERLDLPTLNAISQITPLDERHVVVERSLEDEVEVLEVPLPAVLSVTAEINQPRLPTMRQILLAGKKPVTVWKLADLGFDQPPERQLETISTQAPPHTQRKQVQIGGTPEEAAQSLAGYLKRDGII
jgi:electron transfer flavoprotein beta subunit